MSIAKKKKPARRAIRIALPKIRRRIRAMRVDVQTVMGMVNLNIAVAAHDRDQPASERDREIWDAFNRLRDADSFMSQALDLLRVATPKERAEIRKFFGQEAMSARGVRPS